MDEENKMNEEELTPKEVGRLTAELKDMEMELDEMIEECDKALNEEGDES